MKKTARIGIIGMNSIGTVHAESLKKVASAELVAACDVAPELLKAKAAAYNIPGRFTDYKELLKQKDIDAVYVCTPNYLHSVITIAALKAGKHVFCEKPMALNARQAQEMADAARAARRKIQLGMAWRHTAESRMVKDYVDKGCLGRIYHMRTVLRRRRGVPGLGGWFTTKAMSGGGGIIDIGVHFFDLAMWLSNNWHPQRVSAATYSEFGRRMKNYTYVSMWAGPPRYDGVCDVDDYASGLARFAKGATLSFEISWAGNTQEDSFIELLGDKGGVRAYDGNPPVIFTEDNGRIVDVLPKYREVKQFDVQAENFVNVVLGKAEPVATGEQGLAVMKLIDGIYKSARLGKEVVIT